MSMTATGAGQTCPTCGHENAAAAAFCAECGNRLESSDSDSQATTAFSPVDATGSSVSDPPTTWRANDDAYVTQEFSPETTETAAGHGARASADWYPSPASGYLNTAPENRRGFVLGVIAAILILLVIGFLAWSTLLSQGFRDSVTGIF